MDNNATEETQESPVVNHDEHDKTSTEEIPSALFLYALDAPHHPQPPTEEDASYRERVLIEFDEATAALREARQDHFGHPTQQTAIQLARAQANFYKAYKAFLSLTEETAWT